MCDDEILKNLDLSYAENINFTQLGTIISCDLTYLSVVNSRLQSTDFIAMQLKNIKVCAIIAGYSC